MKISTGSFTVVFGSGQHMTFRVEVCKKGDLAGKIIISYLTKINDGPFYKGFGFVNGKFVNLWKKFRDSHTAEFIAKIQQAISVLQSNVYAAGKAYALQTGNCFVCHRELTNPESIEAGIGPECRRKLHM